MTYPRSPPNPKKKEREALHHYEGLDPPPLQIRQRWQNRSPSCTDDQHRLLLQVSSLGVLDECFGYSGCLEIWVRDSDLRSQDFGHVVSFICSA